MLSMARDWFEPQSAGDGSWGGWVGKDMTYLGAHHLGGVLLGELGLRLGGDLADDVFEVLLLVVDALGHGWVVC